MMQTSDRLVGNSFRPGYRFQRYWDTSMALAFFFAEAGTGLFVVSLCLDYVLGMIVGLAITATLKPYFHLAHMGVPKKSWRALARPDRSWVSRGAIGIGILVGFGVLHILNRQFAPGLPEALDKGIALAALLGGLLIMCYQGFAMADSESFALWATPLLPMASFLYASTAGTLLATLLGSGFFTGEQMGWLLIAAKGLLVADLVVVAGILHFAARKSRGGAFSVQMLMRGQYAPRFRNLVMLVGLLLPLAVLLAAPAMLPSRLLATLAMLAGFYTFRITIFRAAVYEPITSDIAGSIGLPLRS